MKLENVMKLVKTQIMQLDEILGGGLPDKSVILMLGEPGSGNDTLAQQIMYQHALKERKVTYFTTLKSSPNSSKRNTRESGRGMLDCH